MATDISAPSFFRISRSFTLEEITTIAAAIYRAPPAFQKESPAITGVAPLESARPGDLCFFDSLRYAAALPNCRASACFVRDVHAALLPKTVAALIVDDPSKAMTQTMTAMFSDALTPSSLFGATGVAPGAIVHPEARLETGVTVDPGAFIVPGAEIGAGTTIGAQAMDRPRRAYWPPLFDWRAC